MTARQVHAVLAAGVHNPELIGRWREEPQLLAAHGVDPAAVDLAGLWKFSGMTVKVRHNGIRGDLPMTFRLMSFLGTEIELFASYATWHSENQLPYAATAAERSRDLIGFLEGWLDVEARADCLLWDLIRHEDALARLRSSGAPAAAAARSSSTALASSESVPIVCGTIVLHEMRFDPRAIVAGLSHDPPRLENLEADARRLCYWVPDGAESIQILELDEFGFYTLSFVDGVRRVEEINLELGGEGPPTVGFLNLLGQLGEIGILAFSPGFERSAE